MKLAHTASAVALVAVAATAHAQTVLVNTGAANGAMAMASRPGVGGQTEIEAADDFLLGTSATLTSATFIGLLPTAYSPADIGLVNVEIYRVFPLDSDVGRTSGPPNFSTPQVPTRVNSPSDVALVSRQTGAGLTFTTTLLSPAFTASNSVLNGINPSPNQRTGGEGPVTGQEVQLNVTFTTPITLPADHYFFIPQVQLVGGATFYWLSGQRPLGGAGTTLFAPDLQAWIRNDALDPDWLRVGTDIVGGATPPTFNGAFSISGIAAPEPASLALVATGLVGIGWSARRRRRGAAASR